MTEQVDKPLVVLAMPRRGAMAAFGASEAFHMFPTRNRCNLIRIWTAGSILDHCFNKLWASALNMRKVGATHFAMIHDDVCPEQFWVDTLLAELTRLDADIVSAVVPIKSAEGLTSTAIETADPWCPRRLTMHEIHELPETFGREEAGDELLLNSGLWVCDLRKPWVDDPEPMVFQTLNRFTTDDSGDLIAQVRSEDWEFSRAARARGAKLFATRKVALQHTGEMSYTNERAWGNWQTDELALKARGEPCTTPTSA